MSLRQRMFAGDTDSFAIQLDLRDDPDGLVQLPDEVWGELRLWVAGRQLTAHTDREGGLWQGIRWAHGSLLEWLIEHWNPLLHEQRLPFRPRHARLVDEWGRPARAPRSLPEDQVDAWYAQRHASWGRHCTLAARSGGPMPDVCLLRRGDDLEVSWTGRDETGCGLRYREGPGSALVAASAVATALTEFLDRTLSFLAPLGDRWSALEARWQQVLAQGDQERMAWLLGYATPSAVDQVLDGLSAPNRERARQALARDPREVPGLRAAPEPALLFGTLSPTVDEADAITLLGLWAEAHQSDVVPDPLEAVEVGYLDGAPWQQGYDAASALRDRLGWGDEAPLLDLEDRLQGLGIRLLEVDLVDTTIPAVALAAERTQPTIALNRRNPRTAAPWGRRMAIAHELGHLLVDRARGRRVAIADGAWAPVPVEQRARAFAAYLLMPGPGVDRLIRDLGDTSDQARIQATAERFGVSYRAAASHLASLDWFETFDEAEAALELLTGP